MSSLHFDIGRTQAYLSVQLQSRLLRPISIALYALVLSPFIRMTMMQDNATPLLIASGILAGALWVAWQYILWLRHNDMPDATTDNIADHLSYHMVQHWSTKNDFTPETMLAAATESDRGMFVLHQIGIERADIFRVWSEQKNTMDLDACLRWCLQAREALQMPRMDSTAVLYAFFQNVPALQPLLQNADLSMEDLKSILRAEAFHFHWTQKHGSHWSPDAIRRTMGAIGKTWVVGYNTELERLTTDISATVLSDARDTVIHQKDVGVVLGHLTGGGRNNVLLVGKPGSGRRTLVRNIAKVLREHEMKQGLLFTDVLKLSTPELLSGSARGDTQLLTALKKAMESGRHVLVIEDLSLLLGGCDAKLADILHALLQAKNLKTIGMIDRAEYHARIKTEPSLDIMFHTIFLTDSTDEETMSVLLEEYFTMERSRRVRIPYATLKSIVTLCKRFVAGKAMPGKAVDVLREAVSKARSRGDRFVTDDDVREVISVQTRVDVRLLSESDRIRLLDLEERLTTHVIGHRAALTVIASALKRAKVDLVTRKRPMGTFLFLGTTGVGKTETAKALAEEYFGSDESFVRIDMNEYSRPDSSVMLVGGTGTSGFAEGYLTKRIQDRPFSLVLLDEVEKAHSSILHLFLQILDEGYLVDGNGDLTDFRNTIIIATSNAGGQWLAEHAAPDDPAKREAYRAELLRLLIDEKVFSPEFLNRFDETMIFYPPTRDEIRQIAILMLDGIVKDIAEKRGIRVTVEEGVIDILAERGYDPENGARAMRRVITRSVETLLADVLLRRSVKRGEEIVIRTEDVRNT